MSMFLYRNYSLRESIINNFLLFRIDGQTRSLINEIYLEYDIVIITGIFDQGRIPFIIGITICLDTDRV